MGSWDSLFEVLPSDDVQTRGSDIAAGDAIAQAGDRLTPPLLGLLAALTYAVDFVATAFGASRFGASPRALWGAVIGAVAGLGFGLLGIVLGPFVGALIGELSARRSLTRPT